VAGLLGLGGLLALTLAPGARPVRPGAVASPLLVSSVSAAGVRDLAAAEQDLITSCMHTAGFRYWPVVPASSRYLQPLFAMPPSVQTARQHGFGSAGKADPNEAYVEGLGKSAQAAYGVALGGQMSSGPQVKVTIPQGGVMGHSAQGCQAAAESHLYGSFRSWYAASTFVGEVQAILQSDVADSSQMTAAVKAWRRCAAARGYHWAALAQPEFAPSPGSNTGQAALADAQCAAAAHIPEIAAGVAWQYASKLDAEYGKELNAYQLMQQRAAPIARKILSGSHSNTRLFRKDG
jgi:hypothetical protein